MRFIRNEIQIPRLLVPHEKRRTFPFYVLAAGVVILIIGTTGFFSAFIFRDLIKENWKLFYRDVQTYALAFGGCGIILYIIGAAILKVPLKQTTYYKLSTIMKNAVFDPPRKGDFSKPIYARLRDLSDDWAFFTEVVPNDSNWKIPQVIVGPGGVFTMCPVNEYPDRRAFQDPGVELDRASRKLGLAINQQVTPIIIFATEKLVSIYKNKYEAKTRVMHMREIENYFSKRKNRILKAEQRIIEEKIFLMIKGTRPGEK